MHRSKTMIPSISSGNQRRVYQPPSTQLIPMFSRPEVPVHSVSPPTRPPSPTFRQKIQRLGISEMTFRKPEKMITTQLDIEKFLDSEGLCRFMDFLMGVNSSIVGKKISSVKSTPKVDIILALLSELDNWISEIPPLQQPQRYGNLAFRAWVERLESRSEDLLRQFLPTDFHPAIVELVSYFRTSFGNGTRIDYGSGHEMNFVAFLCCLDLVSFFADGDFAAIGLVLFNNYLILVRKLLTVYNLEPAGSHGVWGLDDYQFISYIWGSAQLIGHTHMKPKSITNTEIVDAYSKDYIFLSCIKFIYKMKTGPFNEHSPILYDVSGVPHWAKVNSGLVKMFIGEVLEKVPIVQHLEFGSLLPFQPQYFSNSS